MSDSSSRHEPVVTEYYARVDAQDIEWVVALFADDAVYDRAGSNYIGKAAISAFYRGDRKIMGAHTLQTVASVENTVLVNGVFRGQGYDGSPKQIGFADAWRFNEDGLVSNRQTYLATGSSYVKD